MHRFYLGQTGAGLTLLALLVLGAVTAPVGIGLVFLIVLGLWMLLDMFRIPGLVDKADDARRQAIIRQLEAGR